MAAARRIADLVAVGQIDRSDSGHLTARVTYEADGLGVRCVVDVASDHQRAFTREHLRGGAPLTPARAGDENYLALENAHDGISFCVCCRHAAGEASAGLRSDLSAPAQASNWSSIRGKSSSCCGPGVKW